VDVGEVLLHILVVLLAAKVAAEISERIGIPAVVGEIVAGIIVGPSVLGLVGQDEVLRVLGELGVILLLLEVGMEMDLRELGAVGRASMSVASVGVAVPFAAGYGAGVALGMDAKEALFVGAALTATSVGITARVFGDLRALASVEARTVLGAAVIDDVMGLVILTVVTRVVAQGAVSVIGMVGMVGVAVGFLVVTTAVGMRVVPPLFATVTRHSRSAGTLVAVALAFTLAVAELANAARLAPIVGAFVAGLALGRTRSAARIRREMMPVGHLFIPVFFLQIGIDVELGELTHPAVLGLAAVLLTVAILGKLASAVGLIGAPGDKRLVAIGMIPRGEVGLVFATLGLRQAVFGEDVYAAILLVVLVTTLATPPLLRHRLLALRARHPPHAPAAGAGPAQGWFREEGDEIELAAEPAAALTLEVALEAALRCRDRRAGASLLDWLGALPPGPLRWNDVARARFFDLLARGGPRSWRLLTMSGVLERALPELGAAVGRQQHAAELDPIAALVWPRLSRLQDDGAYQRLHHPKRLLLAALVLDVTDGDPMAITAALARKSAQRLGLGPGGEQSTADLVADADLLPAASRRLDGLSEEPVLQLAAHLGTREQLEALHFLALAGDSIDGGDRVRLAELCELVLAALAHPELVGREASDTVDRRRAEARRLARGREPRERIEHAPRGYVLAVTPDELARQTALCDPRPRGETVRVAVTARADGAWRLVVVAHDRPGLLARETGVLAAHRLDVVAALAATWRDGCALGIFDVRAGSAPDAHRLCFDITEALGRPITSAPVADVALDFDDCGSPWHTLATVDGPDRPGLLHALTAAFAAAGVDVHAARVSTRAGRVVDISSSPTPAVRSSTAARRRGCASCWRRASWSASGCGESGRSGWLGSDAAPSGRCPRPDQPSWRNVRYASVICGRRDTFGVRP
jgi:Kef-type K+ transport system membrane component KefB/predicted amino acid-binding ACT domain protein